MYGIYPLGACWQHDLESLSIKELRGVNPARRCPVQLSGYRIIHHYVAVGTRKDVNHYNAACLEAPPLH